MADKWTRRSAKRNRDELDDFSFSPFGLELPQLFAAGESAIKLQYD